VAKGTAGIGFMSFPYNRTAEVRGSNPLFSISFQLH
jgi:hypothetical protein